MPQGPPSEADERIHRTLGQVIAALVSEGWAPAEQLRQVRRHLLDQMAGVSSASWTGREQDEEHDHAKVAPPGIATTQAVAQDAAFLGSGAGRTFSDQTNYWLELHDWYVWWKLAHDDEFWDALEREAAR
jgi:hypothetical protein